MPGGRSSSIKRSLRWAGVLPTGAALLLVGVVGLAYDRHALRDALASRLTIEADIAGTNCLSALLFGDPQSAEQTLAALRADPHIVSAAILTPDGRAFASFVRAGIPGQILDEPRPLPEGYGARFAEGRVRVSRPIIFDGKLMGVTQMQADMRDIEGAMERHLGILSLVLAASLVVSLVIAMRLHTSIARPILALAHTAKSISVDKDYSVRAASDAPDELRVLVKAFNEMLEEIAQQNAALRRAHGELELRVRERTAQLEAANRELEAFCYSVSHDLRAPLRGIDGFSQALLEDSGQTLNEAGQRHLERVRLATRRMGQLIDDLLNLSRLTRAEMQREDVDLSGIVKQVAEELQNSQPDRRAVFRIEDGAQVVGDSRLLRVALENLMGNAWKFTRNRPTAHIEFGMARENGNRTFFVRDDGAGFDMAYAQKLFGAFQRLHSARDFEGTGIGLATVARIVHRHGGRVWAEAAPEKGATFYFTL